MRTCIGVMGSGDNGDARLLALARDLGQAIAQQGWVLVNGGRGSGVMDASALGARTAGGFVVGILPDESVTRASRHLDIAIRTGMGDGRNYVNVLSSDVVVAMRGGAGTISEVALALKAGRTVVALDWDLGPIFDHFRRTGKLLEATSVEETMVLVRKSVRAPAGAPSAARASAGDAPVRMTSEISAVEKLRRAREAANG
jgi:uncharacterized protein (TIGR00725 family)